MNLEIINFATGSADIPQSSQPFLNRAAEVIKTGPNTAVIEIGGHTDNTGDASDATIVAKVQPPTADEIALHPGGRDRHLADAAGPDRRARRFALAQRSVTGLALELVPRITRAQSMDVLSSQSDVAGYKAVLLGAGALPKFLPMLTTAAGNITPAKAFVLGAGVAGLQAIATARRLGAVVSAFDVRPAVREQVQSLGATFVAAELAAAGARRPAATRSEQSGGRAARARSPRSAITSRTWISSSRRRRSPASRRRA